LVYSVVKEQLPIGFQRDFLLSNS